MLQVVRGFKEDTGEMVLEKQRMVPDVLNDEGYRVPSHKLGAKLFSEVPFPHEMTDAEIGKVARLAKLMIADSNMLGYRTRKGIKPYTESQIIEIVGLSGKRGKQFLSKLKKLGVIGVTTRKIGDIEQDEYYINPAYFFAGKRIHLNLYLLFREHLDPILPNWVRREFWNAAQERAVSRKERNGV